MLSRWRWRPAPSPDILSTMPVFLSRFLCRSVRLRLGKDIEVMDRAADRSWCVLVKVVQAERTHSDTQDVCHSGRSGYLLYLYSTEWLKALLLQRTCYFSGKVYNELTGQQGNEPWTFNPNLHRNDFGAAFKQITGLPRLLQWSRSVAKSGTLWLD